MDTISAIFVVIRLKNNIMKDKTQFWIAIGLYFLMLIMYLFGDIKDILFVGIVYLGQILIMIDNK